MLTVVQGQRLKKIPEYGSEPGVGIRMLKISNKILILLFALFAVINVHANEALDVLKRDAFKGKTVTIEGVLYDQDTNR